MERCGRRQDEHSASEWQLPLFQSIIHYRAKCCRVPPLFDLSYYFLCKLLILSSLDGVNSRHALTLLPKLPAQTQPKPFQYHRTDTNKIIWNLTRWNGTTSSVFTGTFIYLFGMFFLIIRRKKIHKIHIIKLLLFFFYVPPSVPGPDHFNIPQRMLWLLLLNLSSAGQGCLFFVPWGCSGAGESLEAGTCTSALLHPSWLFYGDPISQVSLIEPGEVTTIMSPTDESPAGQGNIQIHLNSHTPGQRSGAHCVHVI